MTRTAAEVERVLEMASRGASATAIARATGIPRGTVKDWLAGMTPRWEGRHSRLVEPAKRNLGSDYAYLLGLYLGDGCLSRHAREVYKLRIFLDLRYPGIISETRNAIETVMPHNPVRVCPQPTRCVEIFTYSKTWPLLFPQHGPGRKHHRPIVLADWQRTIVNRHPFHLLRGLIHSDGCRFMNTCAGGWSTPRYSFSNRSQDIHGIFRDACDLVGVRWTTCPHTTYVSRKADVALLDEFIGPKT